MPLRLRDNLHWCDCGGRAVFLDMKADLYFCLPAAANEAFLRLARGEAEAGDGERLRPLAQRGMLVGASANRPMQPATLVERPTRDFLPGQAPRATLLHIVRALAWELRAAWWLKTSSFDDVIEAVRRGSARKASPRANSDERVREIVSASAALSFITRSHNRCLVRALAVHAACRSAGIRPKLVFGVIAHPFTAHCWIQLGEAVLVGGYEQARLFTPILVLE